MFISTAPSPDLVMAALASRPRHECSTPDCGSCALRGKVLCVLPPRYAAVVEGANPTPPALMSQPRRSVSVIRRSSETIRKRRGDRLERLAAAYRETPDVEALSDQESVTPKRLRELLRAAGVIAAPAPMDPERVALIASVFRLRSEGLSFRSIASRLDVSEKTVRRISHKAPPSEVTAIPVSKPQEKTMRLFTDILRDLDMGVAVDDLTTDLTDLVNAVIETGKGGMLTLKIGIKPPARRDSSAVEIGYDIKCTKPKLPAAKTILFATPGGDLVREDPRQASLPGIREVPQAIKASVRDVAHDPQTGEIREVS